MRIAAFACTLALCTTGAVAGAHEDGITGYSGKSGTFCNKCHSGGVAPTVMLDGPTTLAAGSSATYTFTITGGAGAAGGLDAALDGASIAAGARLATVSPSTKLVSGEVTHTQPVSFASGSLTFQLSVVAPAAAGTMTLYVAGNSTNHDGTDKGDRAAATSLAITVDGPPPPPGADLSSVTIPPGEASDLAMAPSPSGRDLTTPAGDPGSVGPPAGAPSTMAQGGCAMAGPPVGGGAGVLALFALCYVAFRYRALRACAPRAPRAPSASATARARR
jgi:hypothetical protein